MLKILQEFLEAIFPYHCHLCNAETSFGIVLCNECARLIRKRIHQPEKVSDIEIELPVFTLSPYDEKLSELVKVIKYKPSLKLLEAMDKLVFGDFRIENRLFNDAVFIPVPLHPLRETKRGFNQAEKIAEIFGRLSSGHLSPALIRDVNTRPQANCDEEERKSNLEDAFNLHPDINRKAFFGKKLVLVDDVATTGNTLHQCWKKLLALEPESITALVLTHSYLRKAAGIKQSNCG